MPTDPQTTTTTQCLPTQCPFAYNQYTSTYRWPFPYLSATTYAYSRESWGVDLRCSKFVLSHNQAQFQPRSLSESGRGRPKSSKAPPQMQAEYPEGMSPIRLSRQGAVGSGTSATSEQQAIDVEQYEEEGKRRNARRLKKDERMFQQFRQERARMIAESQARLLDM